MQRAQKLALQGRRHVADFVEEQGPTVGELEFSFASAPIGACVRARRNTEELRLEQSIRHCRDIDADKRTLGARTSRMDGLCQQFLASTGFAQNEHRRCRPRGSPCLLLHGQAR